MLVFFDVALAVCVNIIFQFYKSLDFFWFMKRISVFVS